MLQHGDEVFLEQRPPVGLWGGLFCFPQFTSEQALTDWLAARGIHAKPQQLPRFATPSAIST